MLTRTPKIKRSCHTITPGFKPFSPSTLFIWGANCAQLTQGSGRLSGSHCHLSLGGEDTVSCRCRQVVTTIKGFCLWWCECGSDVVHDLACLSLVGLSSVTPASVLHQHFISPSVLMMMQMLVPSWYARVRWCACTRLQPGPSPPLRPSASVALNPDLLY